MTKLTLKLTRPAKSRGGDRYEETMEGEDKPLVIYLPQSITRKRYGDMNSREVIAREIKMTLEVK